MKSIHQRLAEELEVAPWRIEAAVGLLDDGATVPFIARYRKEVTGTLDDTRLRTLEERLRYLRELDERRDTVLKSIDEQDKLTPHLRAAILAADTKTRLEDLYLPYRPKRRTKAQIAREAGLEPLALGLLQDPELDPLHQAEEYVVPDQGVADVQAALDGARQILTEHFAEDAELLGRLRETLWARANLVSSVASGQQREGAKFADYFDYAEPIRKVPSHRALALFRGQSEGILSLSLVLAEESDRELHPCESMIAAHFSIRDEGRKADRWLRDVVRGAWKVKISTQLQLVLMLRVKEAAQAAAIRVFEANLKDLLLAAPAGARPTMGLDPGLRTGVKVAVVDATGKVLDSATIYPHVPRKRWDESIQTLRKLCAEHQVELISIGNGSAARETDRLAAELLARHPELRLTKLMVSEAGASVYSASALASRELPDLDVSLRGAVSIAHRLQDPLAALVKIEPRSIGVGQYQHDVNQTRLGRGLDAVVEDCVNAVGVDVNTASVALLGRVAGLSQTVAQNIVEYREVNGPFHKRVTLKKVPRLGPKAFEQAAGFLRITNGGDPLDASAVHPEAYPVVQRILAATGKPIRQVIGNTRLLQGLGAADFTDERFGLPTVQDILAELEKPGRDPRPEFKTAHFAEGVEELGDLKPEMVLEGVVTNVTDFGAFVDVGVHQDGLVHISALADHFVRDPRDVVRTGDIVKVKVLAIDLGRRRIALTMRLTDKIRDRPTP